MTSLQEQKNAQIWQILSKATNFQQVIENTQFNRADWRSQSQEVL
jgi:hypothetical protein